MNPAYRLLSLSHELYEQLERLFVTCCDRYEANRSTTGRKRKFVDYQLFILHALQYFGFENVHVHFTPMRNERSADENVYEIQSLLRGDLPYVFLVAKVEHWTIQVRVFD